MGSGTIPERLRRGTRLTSLRREPELAATRLGSCSSSVSSESSDELSRPAAFALEGGLAEAAGGEREGEGGVSEPEEAL